MLTEIAGLPHNRVNPSRLQKNIGKVVTYSTVAKITTLHIEIVLASHVGENFAPPTCKRFLRAVINWHFYSYFMRCLHKMNRCILHRNGINKARPT